MRLQRSSRGWSIECRTPGNLCDLSKRYFATTFLSSSLTCPAKQSGLHRLKMALDRAIASSVAQEGHRPPGSNGSVVDLRQDRDQTNPGVVSGKRHEPRVPSPLP